MTDNFHICNCGFGILVKFDADCGFCKFFCAVLRFSDPLYAPLTIENLNAKDRQRFTWFLQPGNCRRKFKNKTLLTSTPNKGLRYCQPRRVFSPLSFRPTCLAINAPNFNSRLLPYGNKWSFYPNIIYEN